MEINATFPLLTELLIEFAAEPASVRQGLRETLDRIRELPEAMECPSSELFMPQALVRYFPCQNCGAARGEQCKHDHGCVDADRRDYL